MVDPQCTKCSGLYCESMPVAELDKDALPRNCPIKASSEVSGQSAEWYREDAVRRLYVPATITEKEA